MRRPAAGCRRCYTIAVLQASDDVVVHFLAEPLADRLHPVAEFREPTVVPNVAFQADSMSKRAISTRLRRVVPHPAFGLAGPRRPTGGEWAGFLRRPAGAWPRGSGAPASDRAHQSISIVVTLSGGSATNIEAPLTGCVPTRTGATRWPALTCARADAAVIR